MSSPVTEFRMYDPRIARFPSADPIIVKEGKYPELSSYQYAGNKPVWAIDLDGLEYQDAEDLYFAAKPFINWVSNNMTVSNEIERSAGAGVAYALSASATKGVSYDAIGATYYQLHDFMYGMNQNLYDGSPNPSIYVGFGAGVDFSVSATLTKSFDEKASLRAISIPYLTFYDGPDYYLTGVGVRAGYGRGISISTSPGIERFEQATSLTFTEMRSYNKLFSDSPESKTKDAMNMFRKVGGVSEVADKNNNVTGYKGYLYCPDGKLSNFKVNGGVGYDAEGKAKPNGRWKTPAYENAEDALKE